MTASHKLNTDFLKNQLVNIISVFAKALTLNWGACSPIVSIGDPKSIVLTNQRAPDSESVTQFGT